MISERSSVKTNPEYGAGIARKTDKMAFSIVEFSRQYSIGRSSVYLENKRGKLPFRKVGSRTIILATDAEIWAASLTQTME